MPADSSDACPPPEGPWYSYAIVRVVPQVDREEFLNVGIILFARTASYLEAHIEVDEERLLTLAPGIDLEQLRGHLDVFQAIAAGEASGGPAGASSQSERFHWLTAPRSTIIQTSPVHVGWNDDPAAALEELMARMVRHEAAK